MVALLAYHFIQKPLMTVYKPKGNGARPLLKHGEALCVGAELAAPFDGGWFCLKVTKAGVVFQRQCVHRGQGCPATPWACPCPEDVTLWEQRAPESRDVTLRLMGERLALSSDGQDVWRVYVPGCAHLRVCADGHLRVLSKTGEALWQASARHQSCCLHYDRA